jgi:hypothetical protein
MAAEAPPNFNVLDTALNGIVDKSQNIAVDVRNLASINRMLVQK